MSDFRKYTDTELVKLTLGDVVDAYGEIVVRHQNTVFAVIASIVSDHSTVEDIAQDTFIDGFIELSRLHDHKKLVPWLIGIARRKALHCVTRQRYHSDVDEVIISSTDDDPELGFILGEEQREIRAAVDSLPEGQRRVAMMFYFENLSTAEIGAQLAIPPGTVKRRLHDARQKLKERLGHMNEIEKTPAADFAAEVKRKISEIRMYYIESGFERDRKLTDMFDEAEKFVMNNPDPKARSYALADLYTASWGATPEKERLARKLAVEGGNGVVIADEMINEMLASRDHAEWIKRIDEEYLPEMERLNCDYGIGSLKFWRGRAKISLKYPIDEVLPDFEEAMRLIPPSRIYHSAAVAAAKTISFMRENADDVYLGMNVTAEGYCKSGTKLMFMNQPGFSEAVVMSGRHKFDYINYFAACCGMFYDTSMKVGDVVSNKDGSLTLVGNDETVRTPAGTFKNCMHISKHEHAGISAEVWYADGIGIVKALFSDNDTDETYELYECDIKGGDGYFPFAQGNRWRYVKEDLPEYLAYLFENEITWTDGVYAHMSVVHSVTYRRGYLSSGDFDSDYYIARCEKLCDAGKTEEAIDALASAIRENSRERAAVAALAGVDYLTRFYEYEKKGYRLCPSSYNASTVAKGDDRIRYYESEAYSFGPYRYGTRHEENRIFGVKPWRYLDTFTGSVWNEKWVPGYHEDDEELRVYGEVHPYSLTVEDGGSVATPAGTFDDCLKLTINYGVPGDIPQGYFDSISNCLGKKEYWFARGVGIVRFDCDWFGSLDSSCVLVSYKNPSCDDAYLPVALGCEWEYDEVNLTAEGYRAKRIMKIACGRNDRYMMHDSQEFIFLGTEEEYDAFKLRVVEDKK